MADLDPALVEQTAQIIGPDATADDAIRVLLSLGIPAAALKARE